MPILSPQAINAMVAEHWPSCRFVCEDIGQNWALACVEANETDIRPGGYICGPTQFAAADAALWFLAAVASGKPQAMSLTSDLSMRFLSPAIGKRVYARAELNKASARSLVGSVSLWMDGAENEICAIAQGTYILPASEASS